MKHFSWPSVMLAPLENRQVINPWRFFESARFSLLSIDGRTTRPDVERAIIDTASYGKQLGRIEDAIAVLVRLAERDGAEALSKEDAQAFMMLRAMLVEVAEAKRAAL